MAKRQIQLPTNADGTPKSEGLYAVWYDDEAEQVTVQYARGLAKYRYSNFTASMANTVEQLTEHVGRWLRQTVVLHPELYPCEKLD